MHAFLLDLQYDLQCNFTLSYILNNFMKSKSEFPEIFDDNPILHAGDSMYNELEKWKRFDISSSLIFGEKLHNVGSQLGVFQCWMTTITTRGQQVYVDSAEGDRIDLFSLNEILNP